jgi:hypothetical protein
MVSRILLAILLSISLGFIHYYSDTFTFKKKHFSFRSFSAGLSTAYLFLGLLPENFRLASTNAFSLVFIFLLFGFTLFYIAEKYVYQHASKKQLLKELQEEHSIAFYIYHLLLGVTLVTFLEQGIITGLLFFVPISLHAISSSASLRELHGNIRENKTIKLFLSSSTILGTFLALLIVVPPIIIQAIVGFITGVLLYVIIKEVLPDKEEGNPLYFIAGMMLFTLIILGLQTLA